MHLNLGDLILDIVHHVVQLQVHVYANNAVMEVWQLLDFFAHILNKFLVGVKMHALNLHIHVRCRFGFRRVKENVVIQP